VQVTISREAHDKLRRAQDLLRHAIPNGDPAAIFERALTLLVEDLERKKLAAAKRPRLIAATAPFSSSTTSSHLPMGERPMPSIFAVALPRAQCVRGSGVVQAADSA
jgi:hypothetical protein